MFFKDTYAKYNFQTFPVSFFRKIFCKISTSPLTTETSVQKPSGVLPTPLGTKHIPFYKISQCSKMKPEKKGGVTPKSLSLYIYIYGVYLDPIYHSFPSTETR